VEKPQQTGPVRVAKAATVLFGVLGTDLPEGTDTVEAA